MQLIALITFRRNPEVMPSGGARARCKAVKVTISNGKPTSECSQFFFIPKTEKCIFLVKKSNKDLLDVILFSRPFQAQARMATSRTSCIKSDGSVAEPQTETTTLKARGIVRHCIFVTHMTHMYQITYLCTSVYTSLFHNLSLSIIQIPHDFQGSKVSELTPRNRGFRLSESILSKSWKRALRPKRTRTRRASCASRVPRHPKNAAWYPGSGISLRQTACHIGDAILSHTHTHKEWTHQSFAMINRDSKSLETDASRMLACLKGQKSR